MYKKPSNLEFRKVFDQVAGNYDKITNKYAVRRRVEFFRKYAKGKCLEVGAGSGETSKALLRKHNVVVTDISPKMVALAKRKLNVEGHVADAEKLPFSDKSFETLIAGEVIYYLDRPEKFLQEASRVLRKNGRLLVSSASKITEFYDLIRLLLRKLGLSSMYFDDPNKRFVSEKSLSLLLKKNGFRIIKIQKRIIIPLASADSLNKLLEKTPFNLFCSFVYVFAKKI